MKHYANRALIVSCTKDYTKIYGKGLHAGLRAVEDVLKPPVSLLATDRFKAVFFGVILTNCFRSRCFIS